MDSLKYFMLKVLLKERAYANIPAGSLKQVTCTLVGVSKEQISRKHYNAEQMFSKFAFCDFFQTLKSLENFYDALRNVK